MIDLTGKVVVITGGSRGIGAACAVLFAKSGADVVFNYYKSTDAAEKVIREVEKRDKKCLVVQGDIAKRSVSKMLIEKTISLFGRIDILVNNAGIWTSLEMGTTPESVFEERLDELMKVNLNSFTRLITPCHISKQTVGEKLSIFHRLRDREARHTTPTTPPQKVALFL